MRSHSTPADPNPFPMCSDALSLDACQSMCVSYVLKCALARRPSIKMRCAYAQMRFRSTPVDPNAFPMCSDALSLDACRSKCVFGVLKCALARCLSIQMPFPMCSDALSKGLKSAHVLPEPKKSIRSYKKELFRLRIFRTFKTKKMRCRPKRASRSLSEPLGASRSLLGA